MQENNWIGKVNPDYEFSVLKSKQDFGLESYLITLPASLVEIPMLPTYTESMSPSTGRTKNFMTKIPTRKYL